MWDRVSPAWQSVALPAGKHSENSSRLPTCSPAAITCFCCSLARRNRLPAVMPYHHKPELLLDTHGDELLPVLYRPGPAILTVLLQLQEDTNGAEVGL